MRKMCCENPNLFLQWNSLGILGCNISRKRQGKLLLSYTFFDGQQKGIPIPEGE